MGCFVFVDEVYIGIVDKIFLWIGVFDDILFG